MKRRGEAWFVLCDLRRQGANEPVAVILDGLPSRVEEFLICDI